jgi:hypothetical protein
MAVFSIILLIIQGLTAIIPLISEIIDLIRKVRDPVQKAAFAAEMETAVASYKVTRDTRPLRALLDRIHAHCDACKLFG